MTCKRAALLSFALSALLLTRVKAADPLPGAAEWIPQGAVVVLEVSNPDAILDLVLHPKLIEAVTSSEPYKANSSTQEFLQFQVLVRQMEQRLGADWQTAVRKLVGGGITWSVGPGDTSLLIVDSLDAEMLKRFNNGVKDIATWAAASEGEPERVASTEYLGVTTWSFGPNETHAIIDNRLVLTNKPQTLKDVLDLRAGAGEKSLASSAKYQRAKEAAGPDVAATLYADTGVLKNLPGIRKALQGNDNPLAVLLLAGMSDALKNSTWTALGVKAEGDTLTFDLASDGKIGDTGPAKFALPGKSGEGAMPNVVVPRQIAGLSLYRDLYGFYAAKDELFPERTSGLIFFENMMGIFFTGRDLTEEVLAETGPDVRLVVAGQQYDPEVGAPATQIPAFALIMRLKNPKKFSSVVEEAWQKAVGLINFTRGQEAQPGLIIDRPTYAATKYTVAYFSASDEVDKKAVDVRFNFRPCLAMPADFLILSSTDQLAEDLIDALNKETAESAQPLADTHSTVQIDGIQLASILAANRENLIRQNMIDEGHTRAKAEQDISVLLTILNHVTRVQLNIGREQAHSKASLELQLAVPKVK